MPNSVRLSHARDLMDAFARRTGLTGSAGDPARRYLWTDAFAVQTCFGMAEALEEPTYHDRALKLIELVHAHLGKYHPDDARSGWISGLPEEEAREHPTVTGLRIGKELPERKEGEPANERLEWQRDGQYFHYLTRWFNALLQAAEATGDDKYARWAAELILAGGKFIDRSGGRPRMYWKMSTDLSRPLVPSMGAHDPLEGLVCTISARQAVPSMEAELQPLQDDFRAICTGRDWWTDDPLGIGGLLLNTLRVSRLAEGGVSLPAPVHPSKLWGDSLQSLENYAARRRPRLPAEQRLAFRECGLSLGLRALHGGQPRLEKINMDPLTGFLPIAKSIEDFWLDNDHQRARTWSGHLDINTVTLAASLTAEAAPRIFG